MDKTFLSARCRLLLRQDCFLCLWNDLNISKGDWGGGENKECKSRLPVSSCSSLETAGALWNRSCGFV